LRRGKGIFVLDNIPKGAIVLYSKEPCVEADFSKFTQEDFTSHKWYISGSHANKARDPTMLINTRGPTSSTSIEEANCNLVWRRKFDDDFYAYIVAKRYIPKNSWLILEKYCSGPHGLPYGQISCLKRQQSVLMKYEKNAEEIENKICKKLCNICGEILPKGKNFQKAHRLQHNS